MNNSTLNQQIELRKRIETSTEYSSAELKKMLGLIKTIIDSQDLDKLNVPLLIGSGGLVEISQRVVKTRGANKGLPAEVAKDGYYYRVTFVFGSAKLVTDWSFRQVKGKNWLHATVFRQSVE